MKYSVALAIVVSMTTACTDQSRHNDINDVIAQINALAAACTNDSKSDACRQIHEKEKEMNRLGYCLDPHSKSGVTRCEQQTSNAPDTAPAPAPTKNQWYGRDINKTSCIESGSPASKIRDIQSYGQYATTKDLAGGMVEIEWNIGDGRSEVWTFFPTLSLCEASLPLNQGVPSRYE
jgi:hypothetical protein